ncbi:MAG: MFS transporter [Rhizomicrobium sp.]
MLARLANKRELYTAWYTVGLMALLYVVSYVDRYILALLAAPVAKDLHLSDTQLGLLLGFGFAIVFCLAGLPLANWLDHKNRIHFVFAGVMIWSFSTLASAFATSFAWLLVFRGGVGMGEAVLMPATISLIGDLFKSGQRARPIAVFSALATLMGGGAFFLGAASISLAHLARSLGVEFPIWRLTFLILGSPGIVLGLVLLLSVSDPKRTENDLGYTEASTAELIAFLVRNWTFYVPFFLGLGLCAGISLGTVSWVPTLLVRAYKMDASSAGYAFGLACIPAGALGTFLWSAVATWVDRNGAGDGPIWALIGGTATMACGTLLLAVSPNRLATLFISALIIAGAATIIVMSSMVVNAVGPARMRARLVALNIFATSMIGLICGPLAVPLIAKFWPGDEFAIGYSLAAFGLVAGAAAVTSYGTSRSAYRQMVLVGQSK